MISYRLILTRTDHQKEQLAHNGQQDRTAKWTILFLEEKGSRPRMNAEGRLEDDDTEFICRDRGRLCSIVERSKRQSYSVHSFRLNPRIAQNGAEVGECESERVNEDLDLPSEDS